jgi:hypothetical protein
MFKPSDPTLPNHPLRKAMVEAIALECDLRSLCVEDEENREANLVLLARASGAADRAERVWKKAVEEYRATPCGVAPSLNSYRPLLRLA